MRILLGFLLVIQSLNLYATDELPQEYVAVANRASSTLSLVSTQTDTIIRTIRQQDVGFSFEPMYVSHLPQEQIFVVGDRKNNLLLAFDDRTGNLLKTVGVSKGVFHQWVLSETGEVVVVTDEERGVDLIHFSRKNTSSLEVQKRRFSLAGTPFDGVPHDIVIDPSYFYLSTHVQSSTSKNFDRLLKVNLKTLQVEQVQNFAPDIHLGLPLKSSLIVVLEQQGKIHLLERADLNEVEVIENIPGAHGVFWSEDGSDLFVANIKSTGRDALYHLKMTTSANTEVVGIANVFNTKPHNITASFRHKKVYLTHSGGNDRVSILDFGNGFKLSKAILVGQNPFGLAIIHRH